MMTKDVVVGVDRVNFSYNGPPILENIHFELFRGEFLGLVGPNGGGKSTLLKIILGLLRPDSGSVRVLGEDPRKSRPAVGYVPQFASFTRNFPVSVEDTVLLGRLGKTRRIFGYRAEDRRLALQAMRETGIEALRKRHLSTLSGGQLQRVLLARALVCGPQILILDEPTANIDMRGEEDIFDLLKQLNQRFSLILVSHDIGFISGYVERVACLNRTLLCHHTDGLNGDVIQALYPESVRAIHHLHTH